jgi:mono/diheme cytochrome c family protein
MVKLVVVLAACSGAPAPDATGEEIFSQSCASCHSRDLSGGIGPALGAGSPSVELSDDVIIQVISHGRGSRMPAFSRTLSEDQIRSVLDFLRQRQTG